MSLEWHVDDHLIGAYRAGALSLAQSSSVETHIVACAYCRAQAVGFADAARLRATYSNARALALTPPQGSFESGLRRLGIGDAAARIVRASPAARRPWVMAALAMSGFAAVGGTVDGRAATVLLMLAPLVPLAAVALAYGGVVDPMAETEAPLPYPRLRLVLLRALALLTPTVVAMVLAAALLPGAPEPTWLLPSLGLSLLTLVLARGRDPSPFGGAVALAWLTAVAVARTWSGNVSAVYSAGAQLAFAVLVITCCAALAAWMRTPDLRNLP